MKNNKISRKNALKRIAKSSLIIIPGTLITSSISSCEYTDTYYYEDGYTDIEYYDYSDTEYNDYDNYGAYSNYK